MLAYFDCFSGISGDMTLGAFIDLGVPMSWLEQQLAALPLDGFEIKTQTVMRKGIKAPSVVVNTVDTETSRDYTAIRSLIDNSPLSDNAREYSLNIFKKIAEAEAEIHGCAVDKVHFHELGSIDAIVDIVGAVLCVEYLGIDKITASRIPLGSGFVECEHGTLPVPAPATMAILKDVPVYGSGIAHELVTPTGAAIVTTLADAYDAIPAMRIYRTGYGAGKQDFEEIPNLLRIITGSEESGTSDLVSGRPADTIMVVESCIDDMNPEIFGYTMERLFEDGALDVYWIPVYMKKNRPGTMIKVLCQENDVDAMIHRILSETTTTGVRYYATQRKTLVRGTDRAETEFGPITVKKVAGLNGETRIVPEYEECRRLAREKGLPIRVIYEKIIKAT